MEWQVDPAVYYISGTVTFHFEVADAGFQQVLLDLSDSMTVNQVLYHGSNIPFVRPGDHVLQIDLPSVVNVGELDSVTITYEGAPYTGGFGSFVSSTHDNTPVLWTLSEPYGAKDWWVCKQDLNDKMDSIDIFVTCPSAYRVGSNGLLQSENVVAGQTTYHWKHRYPIVTYLVAFAVTNYAVFSDYVHYSNGDSLLVLNYVYPENLATAEVQVESTIEQVELYDSLFGIYPFFNEKYGHAQFSWGGGMEHQTMSFMVNFSYDLQAHELAHQWFGNKVTCGSWQDIWLNEGFATYLTGLCQENLLTPQDWYNWKEGKILSVTSQPGGATYVTDTSSVWNIFSGRLSYNKGSYILHMLRWKIGDSAFFQACTNYLDDPDLAYGFARTDNLKDHLEATSGLDLTEFLNDWLYGQGYPSYYLGWQQSNDTISFVLEQTTSDPSVSFFEMPVPVYFYGENQDTIIVFEHTSSGQNFEITLPFEVEIVSIDPDLWLLSADNEVENVSNSISKIPSSFPKLNISPNPVVYELKIKGDGAPLSDWLEKVRVTTADGKIVEKINKIEDQITLDARDWAPGVYWVTFRFDNQAFSKKVVKR